MSNHRLFFCFFERETSVVLCKLGTELMIVTETVRLKFLIFTLKDQNMAPHDNLIISDVVLIKKNLMEAFFFCKA